MVSLGALLLVSDAMSFQDFVRKGGGTARVQAGERVYSDLQRRSSSSLPLAACIASSEDAGPSTSLEARRTRIAGIIFGISTKVRAIQCAPLQK